MNKKGLDSQVILLINGVLSKYSNITKAVLFGSRAKGLEREGSDIDIAIFGIEDELKVEEIAMVIDELPIPYKFDLKAYDEITNSDLREHIDRVGIVLYERK